MLSAESEQAQCLCAGQWRSWQTVSEENGKKITLGPFLIDQ